MSGLARVAALNDDLRLKEASMAYNDWLTRRRIDTPERVAIVDVANERRFTYAELDRRALALARHLQATCGVRPGQRVAALCGNRIELIDLYFACGKIGAILAPLNIRLPARQLDELISDCQPSVVAFEERFHETLRPTANASLLKIDCFFDAQRDACEHENDERTDAIPYDAAPTDVAMILYTSGTTGRAKGAMITYAQIHWNAINTIIGLQLTHDDASFLNLPLFHTGGWHVLFTPLMLLGGRVVLQPKFDARQCNDLLGPERITILFGVPTSLRMMCEEASFATADFRTVRFAIFGGESCPVPVIEAYQRRDVAMRQGYGLTEAGPNCFSLPAADAVRKLGSIGRPNFFVDVRLRDIDGRDVGVNEVGELQMRGPHLFAGYWNDALATAETLRDDWLATGDLMRRDDEGYFYVVGRTKEMYVSGGENVYPAQVEKVLQEHPAVELAAVVGIPDKQWGET
ncbi:MAG: AMP-binding protein, partial [Planctomycetales bacterium]|nr:AMP-binding protein [Planctomycetales bacterium]